MICIQVFMFSDRSNTRSSAQKHDSIFLKQKIRKSQNFKNENPNENPGYFQNVMTFLGFEAKLMIFPEFRVRGFEK